MQWLLLLLNDTNIIWHRHRFSEKQKVINWLICCFLSTVREVTDAPMLTSSLQTFYDRHHELVIRYEISISRMTMGSFPFYLGLFFPLSPTLLSLTIWVTRRVSYRKHEPLSLREYLGAQPVFVGLCLSSY